MLNCGSELRLGIVGAKSWSRVSIKISHKIYELYKYLILILNHWNDIVI